MTSNERNFLEAYKRADTIYFESSLHDIDTFYVLGFDSNHKKEQGHIMALPAFNSMFVSIRHLPVDKYISKTYDSSKVDTTFQQIISISKYPQQSKTEYSIQFKNFYFNSDNGLGNLKYDTILLNGQKITNYYTILSDYSDRDTASTDINQIYWTQAEGLVGYKYNNGVIWTKKSIR